MTPFRSVRPFVVALALVAPLVAAAADGPLPKLMGDAPPDRGRWRMEVLPQSDAGANATPAIGGDVTVCMTAAEAVARRGDDRDACERRLVEDGPERAVFEVACRGDEPSTMRSTITRDGERAYRIVTRGRTGDRDVDVTTRLSYVGTCTAADRVVSLGRDSAVCREARAKLDSGDAQRQCENAGGDRTRCETLAAQARARVATLCD